VSPDGSNQSETDAGCTVSWTTATIRSLNRVRSTSSRVFAYDAHQQRFPSEDQSKVHQSQNEC
jgi:hypothetical protein